MVSFVSSFFTGITIHRVMELVGMPVFSSEAVHQ